MQEFSRSASFSNRFTIRMHLASDEKFSGSFYFSGFFLFTQGEAVGVAMTIAKMGNRLN